MRKYFYSFILILLLFLFTINGKAGNSFECHLPISKDLFIKTKIFNNSYSYLNRQENRVGNGTVEPKDISKIIASNGEPLQRAMLRVTVTFDRDVGWGDCGVKPWKKKDCPGSKYWWKIHAKVVSINYVLVVPDGKNRWVITDNEKVLKKYNLNLYAFKGAHYYKELSVDPGEIRECHPKAEGNEFKVQIMGEITDKKAVIYFSFPQKPVEHVYGNCASAHFDWISKGVYYAWGVAFSGNPFEHTLKLNPIKLWKTTLKADTNPSPHKRDHVKVKVEFYCLKYAPEKSRGDLKAYDYVSCPWIHN